MKASKEQTTRMEDNELSVGHAKLVEYSHNLKSKYIKLSNRQQIWSGPGVPGVHAVHGGWGAWVPGAQLSSPRDAGQASLAVLSPGDVGWHWLGMRNVGQEGRPPPLLGTVGGGGSTGPGRVPFKAPSRISS